jgi:hypothetical protein
VRKREQALRLLPSVGGEERRGFFGWWASASGFFGFQLLWRGEERRGEGSRRPYLSSPTPGLHWMDRADMGPFFLPSPTRPGTATKGPHLGWTLLLGLQLVGWPVCSASPSCLLVTEGGRNATGRDGTGVARRAHGHGVVG